MQILVKKLSDELQKVDFNKMDEVNEYSVNKLLCAIEDLTRIINDAIWDYIKTVLNMNIEYMTVFSGEKTIRIMRKVDKNLWQEN